ncbi:glycosyltransferase [Micromonospora sp. KC213]|uniref:glycosyltransferase n=1 Tax=Micromonospora sp. KC213 TaxID=2530378 RepID=UPI00104FF2D2|nr:glycosyltransferase [Micromonospora sp. KC213]TDC44243.1 glycosyltransferase [Micromonospora sp. KC213]
MSSKVAKVSVVIPTYNRCALLAETLRGLARQNLPTDEFEVIVADDGSSDATPDVVKSFADRLRLKYHFQEDLGFRVSAARNAGVRLADAPLLVFLDTGALVGPDYLRHHLAAHADPATPRAVIGYAYAYRPEDPTPGLAAMVDRALPERVVDIYSGDPSFWDNRHGEFLACDFDPGRRVVPWMLFWATNCSVRTEDYWAVGGFDEDFQRWGVEDMELGFRLFQRNIPFTLSRSAWVIEGPHEREWESNMDSNHHNIEMLLNKHPEPVNEIGFALLTKDQYWSWENDYRALLDWAAEARDLDVAKELQEAVEGLQPGDRVAVLGCGPQVPAGLSSAVLFDFDRDLLERALANTAYTGHHALGLRTPLPDHSVDVVLITSRLRGMFDRWGLDLVREARRIGREVRAPGLES